MARCDRLARRGRVALVTALLVMSGTGVSSAGAATAGSWTFVSAPNPPGAEGTLAAVACPSETLCVAVGGFDAPDHTSPPLAEVWSSGRWALLPPPLPAKAVTANLASVSCPATSSCTAVGSFADATGASGVRQTLVEHLNGTSWEVELSSNPTSNSVLNGVACAPSTPTCVAVGATVGDDGRQAPLAERPVGARWEPVAVPLPAGTVEGFLQSVSCSSGDACTAVGMARAESGATTLPLAERWDGRSWTPQSMPAPAPGGGRDLGVATSLAGVSCPADTMCLAVGTTLDYSVKGVPRTFAERWDGSAWRIEATVDPGTRFPQDNLASVACSSSGDCVAVGAREEGSNVYPLAERWAGGAWGPDDVPQPPGQLHTPLTGVSCPTPDRCRAVGTMARNSITTQPLSLVSNKTAWSVDRPVDPAAALAGTLQGMACTRADACVAVGHYTSNEPATGWPDGVAAQPALAQRWDGRSWSIQPVAEPPGGVGSDLRSVSCGNERICTAVGVYDDSAAGLVSLADRWDGARWTPQTPPNPPNTWRSELDSVSCSAADSCMAVGTYSRCSYCPDYTLAERWDGTAWEVQLPPNPDGFAGPNGSLKGVSCVSATDCMAVGFYVSDGGGGSLYEHWDGSTWALLPLAPPDRPDGGLSGVSCVSSTWCTAVGFGAPDLSRRDVALVEHWDGTRWAAQPLPEPPPGAHAPVLYGVSCASERDCVATGTYLVETAAGVFDRTMALRWNGAAWTSTPTLDPPGAQLTRFPAVSCVATAHDGPSACMAAGAFRYFRYNARNETDLGSVFVEHYGTAVP